MKPKKIPMRKCLATGTQHPKGEMFRVVRTPDGNVVVDDTGKVNGRGAYLKKDLEVFGYYLSTVGNNNDTKTYFLDLYQYSLTNNKKFPFEYFLNYCIRKSYCPKEIKNKNYYFQVLLIESATNNGHKLSVSNVIKDIDVSFGKKLYIHTCFRCEYCKQYNTEEARCKKKHDYKDYKWCKVDDFCNDFLIKDLIVL